MTDNSIVNNNNNEIDIFAEDTPEADGRKQDLKHELEEMRAQLPTIIASAPSREDEMDYTDMEVWCRKWMTFYSSFKDLIKLASDCGVNYDLSRADKKHGSIGHQTYDRLRRRISEIDEAAAKQAEEVARTTAAAQQKKQPRQKKIQQQEDGEIELEVPDGDAAERERPLIKSIRLHGPKRIAPDAPGVNADIESTAVAAMPSAQAGQKKITPRMTAAKKPKETKETKGLVNAVACDRCTSHNRTCYREGNRNVCMDCFRLKVGCSLADKGRGQQKSVSPPDATPPPPHQSTSGKGKDKGKGKQKSVSPPHASPPPPDQSTSAANPNNNNNPGSVAKAGPAPKATATSGKGKVADLQHEPEPERPEPERPAPAASGSQQPYVDILVNRKRKLDVIEIESSAAESDSEKEDANMAGRLDGLRTFLSTFESALGALKQEVFKIDGDLAQKRRRRRLQ
ncbi:hypothetical protein BD769DRAFT_1669181 [Suillus cothurnatus]|nr:hypothetical protein BD769DRAFT_1669181 [Suillus cothurnatus]